LHEYERAVESFKQAIKYDPDNLVIHANIGYILNQQAKYHESIVISDWIISKNNSFINAYINKGYSLLGLLRYQEAIDVLEKARQLDADNITVYLGYARGYAGLGRHIKAMAIYDGIIKYIGKTGESPQLKMLVSLRKEQEALMQKEVLKKLSGEKR
jgi:tetratricopeptide (TPR) repeat protein